MRDDLLTRESDVNAKGQQLAIWRYCHRVSTLVGNVTSPIKIVFTGWYSEV
jgi:hypothetical protein